jgi:hypothetical protein
VTTACTETDIELARSILACPAAVEVVVDGYPHVGEDSALGMRDESGTPTFWCSPGSLMARAAQAKVGALLTLTSGLRSADATAPAETITVTGRLTTAGTDVCHCCGEMRLDVALDLDFVLLKRSEDDQVRIPLRAFRSPGLKLNRGYLQRAVEHANDCHREDLAEAVCRTTGTPAERLLGVQLADLTTHGCELSWVDSEGGHRTALWFSRPARTVEELGVLLRHELHAGIC